jgi:hypothetical protein
VGDLTRKNRLLCEDVAGVRTAKAVITSRAVMVHDSTLLAPSQELVARA